jgi:hypothetical protein
VQDLGEEGGLTFRPTGKLFKLTAHRALSLHADGPRPARRAGQHLSLMRSVH